MGQDRLLAMNSLIETRRRSSHLEQPPGVFSTWFKKTKLTLKDKVKSARSLHALKLEGYLPESFIEEDGLTWAKLSEIYTIEALLEFGFKFEHMRSLGFLVDDFKKLNIDQMKDELNITASDIIKTEIDIHQLASMSIPLHSLREIGFTWSDLVELGGNCETLRALTASLSDLNTYFAPNWGDTDFTKERIDMYDWDTSDYTPVRTSKYKTKKLEIKIGGIVF